jgi:predicted amidohydrolase
MFPQIKLFFAPKTNGYYTFTRCLCQTKQAYTAALTSLIDGCKPTRYNPLLFGRIYIPHVGDIYNSSTKPEHDRERQNIMSDFFLAAAKPSVWGIVFILIVLLGVAVKLSASHGHVKVAMCQILIIDSDRHGNFLRIENAIEEAKRAGAQIACLPESVVFGWVNPDAHKRALPIPGKHSLLLCELARKYQIYICAGLDEKDQDRLYGSAILIDDKGEILLKHRKLEILPELMEPPYTGADEVNAVANTHLGRIGLLICADTHRADILDRMTALKPKLLLVPYGYAEKEENWPGHGREFHQIVINAAKRTGATIVGTNSIGQITKGPWTGRVYGGQSIAVEKSGKVLGVAKDRDRDIKTIQIKLG